MRPTIHHGSKKLRTMVMLKIFGQYNRSSTRPGHRRLRPEGARPPHREEHFKSGSIIPSYCEGSHSSSLQERLFRPSISTRQMIDQYAQTVVPSSSDRPCGLRHGQGPLSVAARQFFFRQDTLLASGTRSQISGKDLLSTGASRLEGERTHIDLRGTSCETGFCTITSWRPLHLRPIQKMRSNQTRRLFPKRQVGEGTMKHLHSEIADAVICYGNGRPLR